MGDLQNPPFLPLLTCFPARLAIFMLIPRVRGLDVTSARAEMAAAAAAARRLRAAALVFTAGV